MRLAVDRQSDDVSLDLLTLTHRLTRAYENERVYAPHEIENDVTLFVRLHETNPEAAPIVEALLFAIEDTQAHEGIDDFAADAAFARARDALRALTPYFPCTGNAIS